MNKDIVLKKVYKGLIVSCQALKDEPLFGSGMMAKMAKAAEQGGAVGIRANTVKDIIAIKRVVNLPVIGIIKRKYDGYEPYITPTIKEVEKLIIAGADIIAIDATKNLRPGEITAEKYIYQIKNEYNVILMADISTLHEGICAEQAGADIVSTTLSGYTSYSLKSNEPDFELINRLSMSVNIPVIAEGKIETPEQAKRCLIEGAFAVVIGAAITRPQIITKKYADYIKEIS